MESSSKPAEEVMCLPSGAKVTAKLIKAAKNGEFMNMSDFAPVLEPMNMTETSIVDGELIFRPKRAVKSIDSFLLWSMAWAAYEGLLMEDDTTRYASLTAYRCFIQICAAKYWWSAVYSYDVKNRASKSMSHSLDFQIMDHDIYVSTLDSSTAKSNVRQCSRCRSIWHVVRECPFPEECAVASAARPSVQASTQRYPANSTNSRRGSQVCFNFNAGRCNSNPCDRRHVCERCGGPDPLPRCPKCNPPFGNSNSSGNYNSGASGNYPSQQSRMG